MLYLFIFIIIVLAGISFGRYFYLLKQNYNLNAKLIDVEQRIQNLQGVRNELEGSLKKEQQEYSAVLTEKQQLHEQLTVLRDALQQKESELTNTRSELAGVQNRIELLKGDYTALEVKVDELRQERDMFEARFNSLPELQKAIKLLQRKVFTRRGEMLREQDARELREGNRGYVIWQGKPTTRGSVRIEVLPFEP